MRTGKVTAIRESEELFYNSRKEYKCGKIFNVIGVIFAILGFACIVFASLDVLLINGEPIYAIDDQLFSTLILAGAGLCLLTLVFVWIGCAKLCKAYRSIYARSEFYRQDPVLTAALDR